MAVYDITCGDVRHALRAASPGWRTVLGTSSVAGGTAYCQACAAARELEAIIDDADATNRIEFRPGSAYRAVMVRKYATGEVLGEVSRDATLAAAQAGGAISNAERLVLNGTGGSGITVGANLFGRLFLFAKNNGT